MRHNFDPNEILQLPLMANLATVCSDGPRNAPVWFKWEDDRLWLLGSEGGSSVRRLKRNSQCAVEIVRFDNEKGILLHLGFRGNVTIEPCCPDRFKRLMSKYLGDNEASWNNWFIENIARVDDPDGRMICLIPRSTFTSNASFFEPVRI